MKAARIAISILWFPILMLLIHCLPFDHLPSTCIFFQLTGYPCATCGMTRAMMAIADGSWHRAATMNFMAYPLTLALAALWIALIHDSSHPNSRVGDWIRHNLNHIGIYGLTALLSFGITRIVVIYAFYK